MNQITTLGGGGRTRVAGSLDEPGQVSVGIVGQGDKPARMLSGNRFETEVDLPSGTSTLQITAADGSANIAQKEYSVVTSPETSRTVTHDADGNLTSDGVRTYEWDTWSRLTKITWASGKTTTFHYNALGERTKMVHVDGATTRTEYYLYDGPRPIQRRSEGTATSNIDREYFSGGERRWNTGTGAWGNYHFTRDHLGSVREVLDSSGTLLARYDYAPYGERQTRYEAAGYSCDVGFTSHFHLPSPVSGQSEVLLAHYRAYDPVLGRWLSQDPIREEGGINLYGYVGGDVAGALDVSGLDALFLWGDNSHRDPGNPDKFKGHAEARAKHWEKCNPGEKAFVTRGQTTQEWWSAMMGFSGFETLHVRTIVYLGHSNTVYSVVDPQSLPWQRLEALSEIQLLGCMTGFGSPNSAEKFANASDTPTWGARDGISVGAPVPGGIDLNPAKIRNAGSGIFLGDPVLLLYFPKNPTPLVP